MRNLKFMPIFHGWPWWAAILLGWAAGCATGPSPKTAPSFIYYPPPPDPPRLQYLTSFSGEKELGGESGRFAAFVTGATPQHREITKPYGMALHGGQLYVCDTSLGAIAILDLGKRKFSYLEPQGGGQVKLPINLTIDGDGNRYVADRGHNQVLMYGPDNNYLGAILDITPLSPAMTDPAAAVRPVGEGRGEKGMRPTDVVVIGQRVYVTDLNHNCVRVYDKASRQQLFTIPVDPKEEAARLFAPTNLAVDSQNCLYVSDFAGFCVKKYDAEGKYLKTFGSAGDRPGEFARPKGVAVDRAGRVYVVDAAAQVVQIFDAEGRLLMFFGEPQGSPVPLDLPAQVIIDYEHTGFFQKYAAPDFQLEYVVLVSNQMGPRKVSVYGFGHKK